MTVPLSASHERDVGIWIGEAQLKGTLAVPDGALALVVFAHGSGSSRRSSRNRFVAQTLHERGIGSLLFDLLTPAEEEVDERTARLRFDIPLLAGRLVGVTDWVRAQVDTGALSLGYFGASTGAAAALVAAGERPGVVKAVVSRGGRPDLAGAALPRVIAPTLLIVGGLDEQVIALNRLALRRLTCPARLKIVPHATHLFPEPGALETATRLAADWFEAHLPGAARSS
ncbi:MAG TPA: hypothetical protein VIH11_05275 [Gemmatimonadaceae bacterium]|nr:hypothetical protein [Gemmatimonadaceae bacterium]